jgi:hypothetical protein
MKYTASFTFDNTDEGFKYEFDSIYDIADKILFFKECLSDPNILINSSDMILTGLIVMRLEDKDND